MKTKTVRFRTKVARTMKRFVATGLVMAALVMPFKAKAEKISEKAQAPNKAVAARVFTQYGKDKGLEAGFGIFGKFKLKPVSLQIGTEVAADVLNGNMTLETAHLSISAPVYGPLSATAYAQASRFLGNQKALGGAVHLGLGPVTIHAGAEKDLGGPVPIFAGVDVPVGPVTISPMLIVPTNVPDQDTPRLGGFLDIKVKLKDGTTLVSRAFMMTDPATGQVLAVNGQVGVQF